MKNNQQQSTHPEQVDRARLKPMMQAYLRRHHERSAAKVPETANPKQFPSSSARLAIVGAGIGGLYAGLLLQSLGFRDITIYEADQRLGGRIYTHWFEDPHSATGYQYFEAGAMRIPDIAPQQIVFKLIDYVNHKLGNNSIATIPFHMSDPVRDSSNYVFLNGQVNADNSLITVEQYNKNPAALRFPTDYQQPDTNFINMTASEMIGEALDEKWLIPLCEAAKSPDSSAFEKIFADLMAYDHYSMRAYLEKICAWTEEKINYCETMLSQTNQFHNSFTELCIELADFESPQWYTIDHGMERLPNGCAQLFMQQGGVIRTGCRIRRINEAPVTKKVSFDYVAGGQANTTGEYDAVFLAIPPAALRLMQTPQWAAPKMAAIRGTHFQELVKVGLRFKIRFWEQHASQVQTYLKSIGCQHFKPDARVRVKPIQGGQSTTDLPSRWFVYPPFDIGAAGPGTMMAYTWMSDAATLATIDQAELVRITLRDLQTVYGDGICIQCLLMEAAPKVWANLWSAGDAMFYPGQFSNYLGWLRRPESNVYFIGEHLSVHHTWICGACESACHSVSQFTGTWLEELCAPATSLGVGAQLHES